MTLFDSRAPAGFWQELWPLDKQLHELGQIDSSSGRFRKNMDANWQYTGYSQAPEGAQARVHWQGRIFGPLGRSGSLKMLWQAESSEGASQTRWDSDVYSYSIFPWIAGPETLFVSRHDQKFNDPRNSLESFGSFIMCLAGRRWGEPEDYDFLLQQMAYGIADLQSRGMPNTDA